jgi:hypothetical protein
LTKKTPPTEEVGRDEMPDFRDRPATLSSLYMSQALDAFGESGDGPTLYADLYGKSDLHPTESALAIIEGERRRTVRRLQAVLFTALATESYANEFLAAHLSRKDFEVVDRLSPINKLVVGTGFGSEKPIFQRGRAPIPKLTRLFKLRDRLVHPKPGFGPDAIGEPLREFEAQFAAQDVADFLVSAAAAGYVLLKRAYGPDHLDIWTDLIWFAKDTLFEFAAEAEDLPSVDGKPPQTLLARLINHRSKPIVDSDDG